MFQDLTPLLTQDMPLPLFLILAGMRKYYPLDIDTVGLKFLFEKNGLDEYNGSTTFSLIVSSLLAEYPGDRVAGEPTLWGEA